MKTGLVVGIVLGAVATSMIMSNEAKLAKAYRRGKRVMMRKIDDMMDMK